MATPASNLANSSVSLLSNNNEKASKLQKKIREQAKLDVFKNLDLDTRGFTDIAKTISEIKEIKDNTDKKIKLNGAISIKYETLKSEKHYKKIFDKYEGKDDNEKEKMYMEIAERIILDRGGIVEYKDGAETGKEQITEDFVRKEYNLLNEEDKYKDRLDFFTIKDKNGKLYIIKRKNDELKKIKEREDEIKDEEIERLEKENEKLSKASTKKVEGNDNEESKDKNEENKKMEDLIKKLMEDSNKKNEARFAEIEKLLKNKNKKSDEESRGTDSEVIDEEDNENDDNLEDSEALDENLNYISRSSIERLIVGIRGAEGYPKGTIKIREEVINVEEFEFYEEFKQEYIEAKGDTTRLSKLDKEFAEMIILFSPKGADYKNKFRVKLSESELKDGLCVSEERLARYGVRINVTKYEREVVEKEIIRERRIVRNIETVITELQTSIIELTKSISIEKSSSTIILEEIRKKRELLLALKKKQETLLASLKGLDNNDEELKKLREEEARLQKEYEDLLKKRKHQNKVNKRIEEIEGKHNILKDAKNAVNSMEKEEIIDIEMEDGKKISLIMVNKKSSGENIYRIRFNSANLFEGQDNVKGSEILDLLTNNKDKVNNVEILKIGGKKINISFSISEEEKEELNKLKEEQKGFDLNIDKTISDKKKELDEIRKLIEQKESNNKKRVVVEEFDDGDEGAWFARYCEENGIKRKDGKEISRIGGMDPNAIYVDKDGKELKLEPKEGANDDGYDNPVAHYELVYYEGSENGERSELEIQLIAIIEEQEALLAELESLETLLITAKTKEEKIKIKEQIRIINKRLTTISQKITEFESFIQIYKSRVTIRRYTIYQVVPFGPTPVPNKPFEMTSVISDMGTDVFREKAALKVEEELKRQYKSLGRWQMGSRLALFLGRGSKRKKMMKNEMNNMANTAFQTGANYATLNEQSQNAADRHGHELLTNMAAVNRITTVHNVQVDQLCKDYLNGRETDATFQTKFNAIVAADANIQNALNGQNITHIGTNILLQLKEHLALKDLIGKLDGELAQYSATGNTRYKDKMENFVEQYIRDYQKTPAFMTIFEPFIKSGIDTNNSLERYLKNQKAIMKMQITNLTMNIDILNRGRSAYQIDNKDREKGWKYKVGHFMDKHPRGTAIGSVALGVGLGVATAPLSAVAGAAVTTGVFGSYVGFTNYVKKWTHHTKEQNTHEKNVVTDYRNEQAKIQNWQNLALNGHGRKKYKAKRQLALYDQTTQANIQLSNQISEYITNLSAKTGPLTPNEDNFMKLNLIEGWARLKYYRAMGHNFLASEKVDETEKDMRRLEKAITLGLQKISQTTNNIETTMTATNTLGTNITYAVIQNDLKASYDKSLIQFKRERRWLALRYGIGTAALSIGTALGMQYLMGTGVFAKGKIECPDAELAAVKDNFALGKAELLDGSNSVYVDSNTAFSSITQNGTKLNLGYGAGTDATRVIPGRLTLSDLIGGSGKVGKIPDVKANIDALVGSNGFTQAHADVFKDALNHLPTGAGTNGVLQNMRQAEGIEQWAKALVSSGKSSLIKPSDITIAYDPSLDVIGTTNHTLADRVFNGIIEIAGPCKETEAPKRGRWLMGVPLFFNTFKDRKANKNETTDQNFGSNAQGNQQQQPRNP